MMNNWCVFMPKMSQMHVALVNVKKKRLMKSSKVCLTVRKLSRLLKLERTNQSSKVILCSDKAKLQLEKILRRFESAF